MTLHAIERADRDALQALQLQRLQWSVRHAYTRVAPFRANCEARGVHPDDLTDLAALARFPTTDKEALRAHYPYGLFAVPMAEVARLHASSGTTGRPTVVGYTRDDLDMWADLVARSLYAAGARPGDRVHVAYGYGLFTGGLGAHYGAERLGCTVIPVSGGQTARQVQLICDLEPTVLMATPSYALAIADEFARQGLDPRRASLRIGVFGAEPWSEAMRSELEALFAIDAVDIYGLSEILGPGVACECAETKDGLHVWEDHFYPEIIDPVTEEVLPDGARGELVFTTLTKQALPMIRYRTRDLTRLLPGTARTMRRLERITARSDDMLIVRGVNLFPSQIEELLLATQGLAPHYALELTREERMDQLRVLVEPRDGLGEDGCRRACDELQTRIKTSIGVTVRVETVAIGSIERSQGKAGRIRDRRPR
jgi:phenylacetate-CoA ligase